MSQDIIVDVILIWGVPFLLMIVAVVLQWPVIKHQYSEYRLMRTIKKIAKETMHDVMLPDSLGGTTYIEHLVLTANAIVVLYIKRYQGVIFAGKHIDKWTQVIFNHSYHFPNPLQKLEMDIMAIKSLVDGVRVEGEVVFTKGSEFPKGKPENVVLISELEKSAKNYSVEEIKPSLQTAWKRLQEQTEPCSKEFSQNMRESASVSGHGLLAGLLVVAAAVWLIWHSVK